MNIHETIGITTEIFLMLLGLAAVIHFAWQGKLRIQGHLDIGRKHEDTAVRDSLAAPSIDDLTPGQRQRLAHR